MRTATADIAEFRIIIFIAHLLLNADILSKRLISIGDRRVSKPVVHSIYRTLNIMTLR